MYRRFVCPAGARQIRTLQLQMRSISQNSRLRSMLGAVGRGLQEATIDRTHNAESNPGHHELNACRKGKEQDRTFRKIGDCSPRNGTRNSKRGGPIQGLSLQVNEQVLVPCLRNMAKQIAGEHPKPWLDDKKSQHRVA